MKDKPNAKKSISDIRDDFSKFKGILDQTSPVRSFKNKQLKDLLNEGYRDTEVKVRLFMVLLNSIFTHKAPIFSITYRTFYRLVKNDQNLTKILGNPYQIHTALYRSFKFSLHNSNMITTIEKPIGRKSGLYRLTHKLALQLLIDCSDEEFIKNQEDNILKIYEKYNKKQKPEEANVLDWAKLTSGIKKRG